VPTPQQFPGVADVPPFCAEDLRDLEPWIAARAVQRAASDGPAWIAWGCQARCRRRHDPAGARHPGRLLVIDQERLAKFDAIIRQARAIRNDKVLANALGLLGQVLGRAARRRTGR
jgi:hypothetical protein